MTPETHIFGPDAPHWFHPGIGHLLEIQAAYLRAAGIVKPQPTPPPRLSTPCPDDYADFLANEPRLIHLTPAELSEIFP